jgi:hypothetical protein
MDNHLFMIQLLSTPKPVYTRQERIQDRQGTESDLFFMKAYAIFFVIFFFTMAIWIKLTRAEPIDPLVTLHEEICATRSNSPFCDMETLRMVQSIAESKWVPVRLVIWVSFAESSLATNYNKPACAKYNNHWWLKGKMNDNGKVEMYAVNRKKPDKNGCYLYKFSSLEEWVRSFVNTISIGYKTCENRTHCLAFSYVWKPEIAEESWKRNVAKFYPEV